MFRAHADNLSAPDPLMEQALDFLQTWHHGRDADSGQDTGFKSSRFQGLLKEFRDMWNGSYAGVPFHRCCSGHCQSRQEAADKMSKTMIALLLTCTPAVPSPNKWTKVFPSSDFVAMGILINGFLPNIFDIAFKGINSSSDVQRGRIVL